MPEIVRALELTNGSKVADIGAGDGNYEVPVSRVVGVEGRAYAEDAGPDSIKGQTVVPGARRSTTRLSAQDGVPSHPEAVIVKTGRRNGPQ